MRFIIALLLIFFMSGCGMLQSARTSDYVKKQRAKNLDPHHINSCGPKAIQRALLRFGIKSDLKNLSHAMQSSPSCANLMREIASAFSIEGREITFPSEIKKTLKKYGFKIVNIKNLEELDKNKDTALVLVKQKNVLNYHWLCFPTDKNIETFFGKETIVKEIYLIRK